jgi:hypothetical protein
MSQDSRAQEAGDLTVVKSYFFNCTPLMVDVTM